MESPKQVEGSKDYDSNDTTHDRILKMNRSDAKSLTEENLIAIDRSGCSGSGHESPSSLFLNLDNSGLCCNLVLGFSVNLDSTRLLGLGLQQWYGGHSYSFATDLPKNQILLRRNIVLSLSITTSYLSKKIKG